MNQAPHILFLSDNFPPEVNAPASRTFEHCREWVRLGAKVTVITCFPNFPRGQVFPGYSNKLIKKEFIDGIQVIRVWSYIAPNSGFARRVLDFLSFAATSFLAGLFVAPDIIVATSPQFFTTWSGFCLAKVKRKPWVFELRDIWPESIKSVGAMKSSWALRLLEKIELGLYRSAKCIVAVTHSFRDNLKKRGIPAEKIEVITNGVDLDLFTSSKTSGAEIRKKYRLEDKFLVGYIGTHGMAHSLDFILKCLPAIHDKRVHFIFIGEGAMKPTLLKLTEDLKLSNITFLDSIPKEAVPQYLAALDVSLVPLKKSDTFKEVIPSKIFESAAMGKPILLGVDGEARGIIESYRCGLFFEPENQESFVKALSLIQSKDCYESLLQGCLNLAHDYSRQGLAFKMLDILKKNTN